MPAVVDGEHSLQEVAELLGVHYMTAYRYVRLGQLDAHKVGGGWRVSSSALDDFRAAREADVPARQRSAPWHLRLEARLIAGDAAGAWGVVEAAQASGASVGDVYLGVVAPALRSIGDRWERGEIDISVEHRASGIVQRLVGRLGSQCVRRGRPRGSILVGAPPGERHGIASSIVADLLRLEGWEVSDVGADTPVASFVAAARSIENLVAIGISVTNTESLPACESTCEALREAGIGVPVVLGGQAVPGDAEARALGAHAYAADAAGLLTILAEIDGSAA